MEKLTKTEQLILNAIRKNEGTYENLTNMLYNRSVDISSINGIRVHIYRIRKKRI